MSRASKRRPAPAPAGISNRALYTALGLVLVAAVALLAVWQLGGQAAPAPGVAESLPREVTVAQASSLRDSGALVLDVREPDEWNATHIDGATLIPLGELSARLAELPRDREIVVVCRSGNRSAQARDLLLASGFTSVTSVGGGMNAWNGAGLPSVSGQ